MRLLITGASGFVGKNLTAYLQKYGHIWMPVTRGQLDKVGHTLMSEYDVIIHLAGKAHDLRKSADAKEYYSVNFEITKRLYDEFLKSSAAKFIFISSVKAVADRVTGILNEDVAPDPKTDYGKSKLMAEDYIMAHPAPEGKSYFILRPCMIHGPSNKGNLNLLYKFVKKNIPYPLASFDNKRSFLSVENLCYVITKISEEDVQSGIYQVADDEPLSTNQVVKILSESLGKTPKFLPLPCGFVRLLAKIGSFLKLPLNTERLDKLTENYIVDNAKILKAMGAELPVSARSGLKITAESFRSENI